MLTDLVQIAVLGEKKRAENLRFRKHMKSHDHSDRILRHMIVRTDPDHKRAEKLAKRNPKKERVRPSPAFPAAAEPAAPEPETPAGE